MELFNRRYLCFFFFAFIFVSAIAMALGAIEKLIILCILMIGILIGIVCAFFVRKKFAAAVVLTTLIFSFVALFNSFVFVTLPQNRAKQ